VSDQTVKTKELKPVMTPESRNDANEPNKSPKLTMKLLYELINELGQQNRVLTNRVEVLEGQLQEWHKLQSEAAAAVEVPLKTDQTVTETERESYCTVHPQAIRTSRSERHPARSKKSFWAAVRSVLF